MDVMIRCASMEDLSGLEDFLQRANLGTDGLKESVEYFLMMEDTSGQLVGTIGVQPFGDCGLLRSLIVSPGMSEKEILLLFEQILRLTKEKKMNTLYLATNKVSSVSFFEMLGFVLTVENTLPEDLSHSEHIQNILNVDNSIFLKFTL